MGSLHSKNAAAMSRKASQASAILSKHRKALKQQAAMHGAQNQRLQHAAAAVAKHRADVAEHHSWHKRQTHFGINLRTASKKCKKSTFHAHAKCEDLMNSAYRKCASMFKMVAQGHKGTTKAAKKAMVKKVKAAKK